ncbi:hypothetical protein [Alkalihalobacillus sp. BA299]|uniref:hypothetical protein n=1 Tax=Alkalihalobacillus sp. BA299 TaxID=2815938 RepID=UPI001ADC733C|nr:hypothetical protein [Alkalihalobacillus sp. BA299]
MNRRIITLILLLLLSFIGYFVYVVFIDNGEPINLDQSAQQVLEDVEMVKKQQKVYKWVASKEIEEGYLDEHIHDIVERQRDPQNVIQFMFGTIILEEPELFVQTFETETISKDLFKVDNPDKLKVAANLMNQISRNGKLSRVGVINVRGSINQEVTVRIALEYSDGMEIKVPVKMKLYGDAHGEDHEIYYITSSVWDIIEEIESK